jgi:hypothetical protein
VTSQIMSLKIARDQPYIDSTWFKGSRGLGARLPFYKDLIDTAGTFNSPHKKSWLEQVSAGKDSALIRLLLSILPQLHTLEIEETLAMLPLQNFFVRTGAFQNLHILKLSGLDEKPLTAAFYGLMALPKLSELEFSDLYMDGVTVPRIPSTPLNVTTLRLIHCYVSNGIMNKLVNLCPNLEAFAYELGSAHWDNRRLSADFKAPTIKGILLARKNTLKSITILNLQVPGISRIYAIGSLDMFTVLEHLCVNQTFLMPTLRNGDFFLSHGNDLGYYLLNLPPTVKTLELHHCMGYTFDALDRLAKRLGARPTELKLIKVRFRHRIGGTSPWPSQTLVVLGTFEQ